jgi:WD repeat-containing protein 91
MAHIQFVDNLIREYMVFRGFGNALKAFDADLKTDKNKSFRVDKIIEQITQAINQSDLQSLRDIWNNLETNLFNKLEHSFTSGKTYFVMISQCKGLMSAFSAVRKLEQGILKLYLVTAETNKKADKIQEFYMKMSNDLELHSKAEWKDWFCKSFSVVQIKKNERVPNFRIPRFSVL